MMKKTNAVRSILVNPHHGNEGQNSDALRRNLMRYAISETEFRKSASADSASATSLLSHFMGDISINWIPAFAGMTGFTPSGLFELNYEEGEE